MPDSLLEQLDEDGILVIPIGDRFSQKLEVIHKKQGRIISRKNICNCVFVPLIGKEGWKE